jgi:hypothetical protein
MTLFFNKIFACSSIRVSALSGKLNKNFDERRAIVQSSSFSSFRQKSFMEERFLQAKRVPPGTTETYVVSNGTLF